MDIAKLISGSIEDGDVLSELGRSVGANPSQVQQLLKVGLPTLTQGLARNAATPEGAKSLAAALEDHQDDPVDDTQSFLRNVDTEDGAKILEHVFRGNATQVESRLANQTGLQTGQVAGLLAQLAPLVLGALGQQKKEQHVDASGIAGMLGNLMGQSGSSDLMGLAAQFLDADKDGSVLDDAADLLGRFLKR
jgi:hypothetical protein